MKSTGIVRKVDHLGRIVIPVELRRSLEIGVKDPLEIYVDDDKIVLSKYQSSDEMNARQDIISKVGSLDIPASDRKELLDLISKIK